MSSSSAGTPRSAARLAAIARALRCYAVTDSRWLSGRALEDVVEQAILGGATMVQLREKDCSHEERRALARRVLAVCRAHGVPFLVDDDVACAREVGADGVHVGQSDASCASARTALGPDAIVGVSAQTPAQARAAFEAGADYLGVGAVWATGTKTDAAALGPDGLAAVAAAAPLPVVAIGGIHAGNVGELAGTGACGAAVVSELFAAPDARGAAERLRTACDAAFRGQPSVRFRVPSVLTVAGSDSSGGAGIQADLKTIEAHALFGQSVICALTAQNTTAVSGVLDVPASFVSAQLDAVFADIRPDAVKVGMVSSAENVRAVARGLRDHGAHGVVVDPVMVATSGGELLRPEAAGALAEELLPLADVVTPNVPEAEALSGRAIRPDGVDDMVEAARAIARLTPGAVLVKGGHQEMVSTDVLLLPGIDEPVLLDAPVVRTRDTHGTGCTLSSAIACGLACGFSVREAVERAKGYLTSALLAGLRVGAGHGPLWHLAGSELPACAAPVAPGENR